MLDVKVPLNQLFDLFSHCVVNMPEKIFKPTHSSKNLSCYFNHDYEFSAVFQQLMGYPFKFFLKND